MDSYYVTIRDLNGYEREYRFDADDFGHAEEQCKDTADIQYDEFISKITIEQARG